MWASDCWCRAWCVVACLRLFSFVKKKEIPSFVHFVFYYIQPLVMRVKVLNVPHHHQPKRKTHPTEGDDGKQPLAPLFNPFSYANAPMPIPWNVSPTVHPHRSPFPAPQAPSQMGPKKPRVQPPRSSLPVAPPPPERKPFATLPLTRSLPTIKTGKAPGVGAMAVAPVAPVAPAVIASTKDTCECEHTHPFLRLDRCVRQCMWRKWVLPFLPLDPQVFLFYSDSNVPPSHCVWDDFYLAQSNKNPCKRCLVYISNEDAYAHHNKRLEEWKSNNTTPVIDSCRDSLVLMSTSTSSSPEISQEAKASGVSFNGMFFRPKTCATTLARPGGNPWSPETYAGIRACVPFAQGFNVFCSWDRLFHKDPMVVVPTLHDRLTTMAARYRFLSIVKMSMATTGFWMGSLACNCCNCDEQLPGINRCRVWSKLSTLALAFGFSVTQCCNIEDRDILFPIPDRERVTQSTGICRHIFIGQDDQVHETMMYFCFYFSGVAMEALSTPRGRL